MGCSHLRQGRAQAPGAAKRAAARSAQRRRHRRLSTFAWLCGARIARRGCAGLHLASMRLNLGPVADFTRQVPCITGGAQRCAGCAAENHVQGNWSAACCHPTGHAPSRGGGPACGRRRRGGALARRSWASTRPPSPTLRSISCRRCARRAWRWWRRSRSTSPLWCTWASARGGAQPPRCCFDLCHATRRACLLFSASCLESSRACATGVHVKMKAPDAGCQHHASCGLPWPALHGAHCMWLAPATAPCALPLQGGRRQLVGSLRRRRMAAVALKGRGTSCCQPFKRCSGLAQHHCTRAQTQGIWCLLCAAAGVP